MPETVCRDRQRMNRETILSMLKVGWCFYRMIKQGKTDDDERGTCDMTDYQRTTLQLDSM
eukprot:scaffold7900_cov17-Prasinocladus_malaysianus.AAC.1